MLPGWLYYLRQRVHLPAWLQLSLMLTAGCSIFGTYLASPPQWILRALKPIFVVEIDGKGRQFYFRGPNNKKCLGLHFCWECTLLERSFITSHDVSVCILLNRMKSIYIYIYIYDISSIGDEVSGVTRHFSIFSPMYILLVFIIYLIL